MIKAITQLSFLLYSVQFPDLVGTYLHYLGTECNKNHFLLDSGLLILCSTMILVQ